MAEEGTYLGQLKLGLNSTRLYLRNGEQIEIEAGKIEPGDKRTEVDVLTRIDIKERERPLGGRLSFTLEEFNEIEFACHLFGHQLSAKIAKIESLKPS